MSVRILDFYIFPAFGRPLNTQYPNLRESFGALNALVRNSYIDESPNITTHALAALGYGELHQRFKFRWFYSKTDDEFQLQYNSTNNEASPSWTTLIKVRESDGRVTIVSPGGLLATGGFYNFGPLNVVETESGGPAFANVGTLLFNSGDGFYITPDSSGRPIVNVSAAAAQGTITSISNIGAGGQVFKQKTGATAELRTIVGGTNVTVTQNANDLTIASSDTGEVNTASNLGAGTGVFSAKAGVDLQFKSLTAGPGVNITTSSTEINIAAPEFYLQVKESESGGFRKRDHTISFDSNFFYITSGGDKHPLVSLSSISSSDTASNLGAGSGVFAQKSGSDFQFKSLTAGTGITLTPSSTEIQIASTGGGGGFYGVVFKESKSGGRVERDDTLVFDSNSGFYLTQAGNDGKPLLSFHDHVETLTSSSTGTATLISSDTASVGAGHAVILKRLTAGTGITLTPDTDQITIESTATGAASPGFYGIVIKESESGGYRHRDDVVVFDSNFFYVTSDNKSKPFVSFLESAMQILVRESEFGGYRERDDTIIFDSNFFYVTSDNRGKPFVSSHTAPNTRDLLLTDRIYYVRTDGSNSNNGRTNTSSGAFLTIQKAIDVVGTLDLSIYDVTIQLGVAGSYAGGTVSGPFVGGSGSSVTLSGDTSAPGSYVITSTLTVEKYGVFNVKGVDFTPSSGNALVADTGAILTVTGAVIFGAAAGAYQMSSTKDAQLVVSANYTIDGSASIHVNMEDSGYIATDTLTVTLSGTPAFDAYVSGAALGNYRANGMTFSGSATGTRYGLNTNAVVRTGGGGANYFPGNAAGSAGTGAQYT